MDHSFLAIAVVWSDPDLLEIGVRVSFAGWAGNETAYVSRDELRTFGEAIGRLASGAGSAELDAGQPDLSYVKLRSFAYGLNPRLGMLARLGHAGDRVINQPSPATDLRIGFPIEAGGLAQFGRHVQKLVDDERGEALLELPSDWP